MTSYVRLTTIVHIPELLYGYLETVKPCPASQDNFAENMLFSTKKAVSYSWQGAEIFILLVIFCMITAG